MRTQPDRYFDFLSEMVEECNHQFLLKKLHSIEFYSTVPNDDNRGEDGKRLRDIFEDREGIAVSSFIPDGPCTVLEMLIGVAIRMENEINGNRQEKKMPECFWILLNNLELSYFTDAEYKHNPDNDEIITEIIDILLSRDYERNGVGGLFPLRSYQRDQREIEIWYQMMAWLQENFIF